MMNFFFVLNIGLILFLLGLSGIFILSTNLILILVSLELMLLGINLNFILFSIYLDDFLGQLFSLFVLTIAAAEVSIGLAILVLYYRDEGVIYLNQLIFLKQ